MTSEALPRGGGSVAGQCEHEKGDGNRCKATVRAGSRFCFFHDPDTAQQRAAARKAGGRQRSKRAAVLPFGTPDIPLATVPDVVQLLGQTINQTRRGELDTRIANAVGYLAGILLKGLQESDLESRIARLEEQLLNRRNVS